MNSSNGLSYFFLAIARIKRKPDHLRQGSSVGLHRLDNVRWLIEIREAG
jgi:hypothetical protein